MHRASSAPCHADEPEERETLSCPELLRDPPDPAGFRRVNEQSEKRFDLVQVVFNSPGRRKLGSAEHRHRRVCVAGTLQMSHLQVTLLKIS